MTHRFIREGLYTLTECDNGFVVWREDRKLGKVLRDGTRWKVHVRGEKLPRLGIRKRQVAMRMLWEADLLYRSGEVWLE